MSGPKTCKILVAEDDKFLSRAYEFKLSKMGCQILLAGDGEEAIHKIKAEKPDLVLLDIIMPKKTGFDVLEEMKAASETKNIPVIIMSNLGQEADVKKGLAAGATDYVIKANTSLEEVVNRIEKALKGQLKAGFLAPSKKPEKTPQEKMCLDCKASLPPEAKFCPGCGKKIA